MSTKLALKWAGRVTVVALMLLSVLFADRSYLCGFLLGCFAGCGAVLIGRGLFP